MGTSHAEDDRPADAPDRAAGEAHAARADEELRRSEARYRSLVQASASVVWSSDEKGETFEPSPSWEAYTGQRYPGGLGLTWLAMIHPDDRARAGALWAQAGDGTAAMEIRVWNAGSRRYRWCIARGVAFVHGGAREWVGTLTDVDDARRAERAARFLADAGALLADSLDYEQTLGQVARLAVPALADVCAVHLLTDGAVRTVAVAQRDVAAPAEVRVIAEPPCGPAEVLRGGRTRFDPELSLGPACPCTAEHAQGRVCSRVCVPMSARGSTLGVLCFGLLDAAERRFEHDDVALCEEVARRAAIAIDNARLYAMAQRAAAAREEFLTIASHELRTPLAPLKLAVQRLLQRARSPAFAASPERTATLLATVERCTARVAALVDELLDISHLSAERLALSLEACDLAAIVDRVLRRSEAGLRRAGCEVRRVAEGPTAGTWDRHWLETAVQHLVANAAKYGPHQPIDVRLVGDGEVVRLVVRDHGCGIAEAEQARIFDRFERAVSTRHYGGFGLGLWSVRRIIEAHGGSVRVESSPGRGAEFTLELPRRAAGRRHLAAVAS